MSSVSSYSTGEVLQSCGCDVQIRDGWRFVLLFRPPGHMSRRSVFAGARLLIVAGKGRACVRRCVCRLPFVRVCLLVDLEPRVLPSVLIRIEDVTRPPSLLA